VQLGEADGAVGVLDVAEDTAGADRGELLIITEQSHTRTAIDGELDGGVEGEGVGHAHFVDDHQCRRADRGRPVGQVTVLEGPCEFGECVGADAGLLGEDGGHGSRGARPITWSPSWVQTRVSARMAVVFPAPAGAIASCKRAPDVHIWRTSAACPASSAVPFAAISSNARSTATCWDECRHRGGRWPVGTGYAF
jgi:hypothetical protein